MYSIRTFDGIWYITTLVYVHLMVYCRYTGMLKIRLKIARLLFRSTRGFPV